MSNFVGPSIVLPPPPQGNQIEEYDRLNLLGKGAFAIVYRARCRITGTYVAIKMIDKQIMKANRMTERVKQEATIHLRLTHPTILKLYRFFEDENYIYLILELAEYGDIQQYLSANNIQLTEIETAIIMKQIVEGLQYLHANNILHRDMKLPNLLVTSEMKVKIGDFGLATQLTRPDEKHMTMCGTPNYISPEVAMRKAHGQPADIWGLGIVMFTLLVGRPPFDTDGVASTLKKVISSELIIPIYMSDEARDLLTRLLQKDQLKRIRLDDVLCHPFIIKHNQQYNQNSAAISSQKQILTTSTDSGVVMTMASNSSAAAAAISSITSSSSNLLLSPRRCLLNNNNSNNKISQLQSTKSADPYRYPLSYQQQQQQPQQLIESNNNFNENHNKFDNLLIKNRASSLQELYQQYEPIQNSWNRPNDPGGGGGGGSGGVGGDAVACGFVSTNHNQENDMLNYQAQYQNIQPQQIYRGVVHSVDELQPSVGTAAAAAAAGVTEKLTEKPFTTERLQPTRHKTKKVILSIDSQGNVIVELIKYKSKYQEERIIDMCRISKNGQHIEINNASGSGGGGIEISETIRTQFIADVTYNYTNLPKTHWKKYTYASRFVQLVRSKTPKITYYSQKAKCILMESLDDFEMIFYENGEKFIKSINNVRYKDRFGNEKLLNAHTMNNNDQLLMVVPRVLCEHYQYCLNHCLTLENCLKKLQTDGEVFPNISGRRPILMSSTNCGSSSNHHGGNSMEIDCVSPISSSSHQQQQFVQTPRTQPNLSFLSSIGSVSSGRPPQHYSSTPFNKIQSTATQQQQQQQQSHQPPSSLGGRILIPDIGIATKSSNGVLEIMYNDDTQLSILPKEQGGGFIFRKSVSNDIGNSIPMRYTQNDELPELVRARIEQIPLVLKYMAQNEAIFSSSTNKEFQTPAPVRKTNPMRFYR